MAPAIDAALDRRGPHRDGPPTGSTAVDDHRRHRRTGVGDDPAYSLAPSPTIVRRLADLDIATLAQMHGPAFPGNRSTALSYLADLEARISASLDDLGGSSGDSAARPG